MMNNSSKNQHEVDQPLHCGKWTPEEEAYVQCLIEEFQAGYLPIREGTSLRSFLSKMLNCKPKRISKKFEGSDYNGKQVYVSQPYKLTVEEARERRDRLCTLEKKFHQSVAELKNAEGMKQQPYADEALDAAVAAAGLDNMPNNNSSSAASYAASMPGGMSMGGMNMSNSAAMGAMNMNNMNMNNELAGQNSQILDELAFQESMMRLRTQQQQHQQLEQQQQSHHQQQQPNNQNHQQQQQNQQQGGGSYVDPILGSLALSQNTVNTTPLAASQQYWRRQALLEASSHLDSIRMAQAGAIGIQRPALEPGGLRDLRVPLPSGNGMAGGFNDFGDGSMDGGAAAAFKKRQMGETAAGKNGPVGGDGSYNNKRMRLGSDIPQDASKFGRFTF